MFCVNSNLAGGMAGISVAALAGLIVTGIAAYKQGKAKGREEVMRDTIPLV
jgi:hypothetical protein